MKRFLQSTAPWLVITLSFVSAAPVAVEEQKQLFPPELTRFVPYERNPVFLADGEGHWDARIRERGWILRDGETWRMWFTGYDGTRDGLKMLGYATSRDGLRWTRHPDNPIYREQWVEDMMIVPRGGMLYLFAEGARDRAQLLTSPDGIHWKRVGQLDVRKADGTPLDDGPYGTPTAWYEEGTWYLFYERSDLGIWLAKSRDMKVWINVQDEPVLTPGPDKFDRAMVALNQILKHNGRYYALYHGSGGQETDGRWAVGIAASDDLIHWTKFAGNPLRPIEENKSSGLLVHDGQQFRLYTMHDRVDVHFPRR